MAKCPETGLILPTRHIDQKVALKKVIEGWLEKATNMYQYLKHPYFLTFHAKFNQFNSEEFGIDAPKVTSKIPDMISNSIVYWVDNKRGIAEMLWMVPPKKPGEKKLRVQFNTTGVAYLQAKGAMPRVAAQNN
jgi:hypothetical protein